ncbi:PIN domain-containing protein [Desulfococcaceae bacterium HSG8]|nr:PIN domain-containing protein [Desulfococcaceae bacterium HSG8]
MRGKYFLDTNILIYTVSNVISKKEIAVGLLSKNAVISTQVISESANVMHRKLNFDYPRIRRITDKFAEENTLRIITHRTIRIALDIAERYGYSYYDSQVIASALENTCGILYSEDLQHSQSQSPKARKNALRKPANSLLAEVSVFIISEYSLISV